MVETSHSAGLSKAQLLLQQLKASYLVELPERINELEQLVLGLSRAGEFVQRFEELYRKTHSLKGSAGTYGIPIVSAICHQLEETLNTVTGNADLVNDVFLDRCIAYLDLMQQAATAAARGQTVFPEIESAMAGMRAVSVGKKLTVLLLEPSKVNVTLYLGMLRELPIQFSLADNGYAALEQLLQYRFDMVITGYEMPMLNGAALIGALRLCQCPNQHIHAILITSTPDLQIPAGVAPDLIVPRDARTGGALLAAMQEFIKLRHGEG